MSKHTKIYLIVFALIAVVIFFVSTKKQMEYSTHIFDAMDTSIDITLITDKDGKKVVGEISDIIYKYDKVFSHTDSEGEIYELNQTKHEKLSNDTYSIIQECEKFYHDTNGKFDITTGMLSDIWNESFNSGILPEEELIKTKALDVGYNSLEFNDSENSVKITKDNQKINLGALAKGYTADKIKEIIDKNKIKSALINLGGNIYVKGKNKNGDIWNIGIKDPVGEDEVIMTLKLTDKFVITSGNYIRYADIESVRYHHIIDAATGYPVQNELNSVTIISDNGLLGDALSTSCFLVGFEESKKLLEKYNVSAVFATKDNKVYYSKALEKSITKSSENYEYIPF